jgi:hypothetical protein
VYDGNVVFTANNLDQILVRAVDVFPTRKYSKQTVVEVKVILEQAVEVQRENRGIALPFL